jgi:hypothetical protein
MLLRARRINRNWNIANETRSSSRSDKAENLGIDPRYPLAHSPSNEMRISNPILIANHIIRSTAAFIIITTPTLSLSK